MAVISRPLREHIYYYLGASTQSIGVYIPYDIFITSLRRVTHMAIGLPGSGVGFVPGVGFGLPGSGLGFFPGAGFGAPGFGLGVGLPGSGVGFAPGLGFGFPGSGLGFFPGAGFGAPGVGILSVNKKRTNKKHRHVNKAKR
jgi:hypothetical protein